MIASQYAAVAAIGSYLVFGERLNRLQLVGGVVLMAGIAAVAAIQAYGLAEPGRQLVLEPPPGHRADQLLLDVPALEHHHVGIERISKRAAVSGLSSTFILVNLTFP